MQFGRYQVVRMLGHGGHSTVYEAIEPRLNQRVAIKALHPGLASSPEHVARFEGEARITNGIHHPGIVSIYDLARLRDGTIYHVMEFLEGETLEHRIARRVSSPLEPDEIYRIARQIADTMCGVHAHGIVHRDLKPQNLMLVPDPFVPGGMRVKVFDFGVAKILNHHDKPLSIETKIGVGIGTVDYIAPEQVLDARNSNDRADVYALGCILFELATGRKVFTGETNLQVLGGHLTRPAPSLLEFSTVLPREFAALVGAMLTKEQSRRPAMRQVVGQLDALSDAWTRQGSNTIVIRPGSFPLIESMRATAKPPKKPRPRRQLRRGIPVLCMCMAFASLIWLPLVPGCLRQAASDEIVDVASSAHSDDRFRLTVAAQWLAARLRGVSLSTVR